MLHDAVMMLLSNRPGFGGVAVLVGTEGRGHALEASGCRAGWNPLYMLSAISVDFILFTHSTTTPKNDCACLQKRKKERVIHPVFTPPNYSNSHQHIQLDVRSTKLSIAIILTLTLRTHRHELTVM